MLPFTIDQFFAVFAQYNEVIWPAQLVAYAIAIIAIWLVFQRDDRWIAAILGVMWAWTGIAYQILEFSAINGAAYAFGALFVLEAGLLLYFGFVRSKLRFGFRNDLQSWVGCALIAYAMAVYPLIGLASGHLPGDLPAFGVTPCPVTVFTFGLLLLTTQRVSLTLLAIPVLWSLIGGSAALLLNVPQDWLLLFGGVATTALLIARDRRQPRAFA